MEEMFDKLNEIRKNNEEVLKNFLNELEKRGFFDQDDKQDSSDDSSDSSSENDKSSNSRKKQSKTIRDLEDIKRALEKKKEIASGQQNSNSSSSQSGDTEEQKDKDNKSTEDKLTDLIDNTIDQIKDSSLSDEEKEKKAKELANKLEDVLDNQEDKPDPENANEDTQKKLDKLAKKIEKEAAEQEKKLSNTDLDRSTIDQDLQARIDSVEDILNDANELESTLRDTERKEFKDKRKEKTEKEKEAELNKYSKSNYSKKLFLAQLDRLIRSQIDRVREPTYNYPSRKRVFGSNIIFQGQKWQYKNVKPKVVVYYDRSGSWQTPNKTKAGDDAIAMLNENYVRKNLIDLELRYFGDDVSDNPEEVGGGTSAGQLLLDDIVKQRATNVIIMTDSDMDGNSGYRPIEVPGGVFFLFVDGVSDKLIENIHGKQLTQVYTISVY